MKTLGSLVVIALFVLCAASAFGQAVTGAAVLSAQPQVFWSPSHAERAAGKPLATEQSLVSGSTYTYAKGERPLWEVAPKVKEVPLGDAARELRRDKAVAQKARKVYEN